MLSNKICRFYSVFCACHTLLSRKSHQTEKKVLMQDNELGGFGHKYVTCCCLAAKLCLTLLWPHGLYPARLLCPWDFPGKNIGVGCHFLLQGIFPTQGSNPCLLHRRWALYHWATWGALVCCTEHSKWWENKQKALLRVGRHFIGHQLTTFTQLSFHLWFYKWEKWDEIMYLPKVTQWSQG